jgi:hypothetical protein
MDRKFLTLARNKMVVLLALFDETMPSRLTSNPISSTVPADIKP